MHSKEEDQFLRTLSDKAAQAKGQEPNPADWDAFQTAYAAHKAQQKEKKKRPIFWFFFMGLMGFAGFAFLFSQAWNKETPSVKNAPTTANEVMVEKPAAKISKISKELSQTAQLSQESTKAVLSKKAIRFEPKPSKPKNRKATQKEQKNIDFTVTQTLEAQDITKPSTTEMNSLHSKLFGKQLTVPLGIPNITLTLKDVLPSTAQQVISDSTNNLASSLQKNKNKSSMYVTFGGLMQLNNSNIIDVPAPKIFAGLGLHVGRYLNDHWSISAGLNSTTYFKNQTNLFKQQVSETYIVRIDTSIKYNVFYSRLMMKIDTITAQRTVEKETQIKENYQSTLWSMPLQMHYYIGSGNTQLFASAGAQMSLLSQTKENKNKQSLLFAPSFGLGLNQKLSGNWWLNGSVQYIHFLGTPISSPQNFQLQTGLLFQF